VAKVLLMQNLELTHLGNRVLQSGKIEDCQHIVSILLKQSLQFLAHFNIFISGNLISGNLNSILLVLSTVVV
jgi:hypothetical protein